MTKKQRFITAVQAEVPAASKMDNLKAMVETVEQYGRYE